MKQICRWVAFSDWRCPFRSQVLPPQLHSGTPSPLLTECHVRWQNDARCTSSPIMIVFHPSMPYVLPTSLIFQVTSPNLAQTWRVFSTYDTCIIHAIFWAGITWWWIVPPNLQSKFRNKNAIGFLSHCNCWIRFWQMQFCFNLSCWISHVTSWEKTRKQDEKSRESLDEKSGSVFLKITKLLAFTAN